MPHNIYSAARGAQLTDKPTLPHWQTLTPEGKAMFSIVIQHALGMGIEQGASAPNAMIRNIMVAFGMEPSDTVTLDQIIAAAKAKFSPKTEEAAPAEAQTNDNAPEAAAPAALPPANPSASDIDAEKAKAAAAAAMAS